MSAQDDHNALQAFIEWMGLEGDEASKFIKDGMERRGHKPVLSWADADDGKNDKSTGFGFSSGKSSGKQPWSQYNQS